LGASIAGGISKGAGSAGYFDPTRATQLASGGFKSAQGGLNQYAGRQIQNRAQTPTTGFRGTQLRELGGEQVAEGVGIAFGGSKGGSVAKGVYNKATGGSVGDSFTNFANSAIERTAKQRAVLNARHRRNPNQRKLPQGNVLPSIKK
jgi:hypothetical protein